MFKTATVNALIIAALIGLGTGAAGAWWLTAEYKDNKWEVLIARSNQWAAEALQVATEQTRAKERDNQKLADKLEVRHVENELLLDQIFSDNQRLVRELNWMRDYRDKQDRSCTMSSTTDTTSVPTGFAVRAKLSAEDTRFLLEFAREADRAAQYAQTCFSWVNEIGVKDKKENKQ